MTFWFRSVPHDGFLVRAITSFKSLAHELLFLKYQVWKSHQLPSVLLVLPRKLDFFNLLVTDLFTWAKWSMYAVFYLSLKHTCTTTQGIILIYIFLSQVCVCPKFWSWSLCNGTAWSSGNYAVSVCVGSYTLGIMQMRLDLFHGSPEL